jgi:uncharacterized protein YbjT (DUF2867 family)
MNSRFTTGGKVRGWPFRDRIRELRAANRELGTGNEKDGLSNAYSQESIRMNIILFGATGMVGQGVLRECLLDSGVASVVSIGRSATGVSHPKLREIAHADLSNYAPVESELAGFDACFFCLGISSAGMNEKQYSRITYDITLSAAETLVRLNSTLTFVYVSGQGTDSTEHGRTMWARVKGRTENALLHLPFKAAFMFRPGVIVPRFGARSRTALYRIPYALTRPLLPFLLRAFPNQVLTTDEIGQAMLIVARRGAPKQILETADIRSLLTRSFGA